MKELFDQLSFQVSKATTQKYSTSFSFGIKSLSPKLRPAIYAVYGFVRLADEIVDSFHGYDKTTLLHRLKEQTWQALDEKISLNPILQSFQETVHKYKIERELISQFLKSMEMDLSPVLYDKKLYDEYILGSAEVVGLMCLQVFVEGDKKEFEKLKRYAMKLGSAFQKVNFLRDLKDDYQVLGRSYFPNADLQIFDRHTKSCIEREIESEFDEASIGIRQLPVSSRYGVYLAYRYYVSLFRKIKFTPSHELLEQRIRISNGQKLVLMMVSYFQCKLASL